MDVIHPSTLLQNEIKYARRAHLVLSFLAHFYIHSQPAPTKSSSIPTRPSSSSSRFSWRGYFANQKNSEANFKNSSNTLDEELDQLDLESESRGIYAATIPASISIPFIALSNQLGLPPILTYSTTVLWNWSLPHPNLPLSATNYSIPTTFTNSPDEEHFYATSLLIEIKGVEALKLMRVSLDEAFLGDNLARKRIAINLKKLSLVVRELAVLIEEVKKDCNPEVFYWGIRPWFRGGDSDPTTDIDGEKGWHYEGVDPPGVKRNLGGPSAGQSSLIHSIDVFLDVDHTRKKTRVGHSKGKKKGEDDTFMVRMLDYMPGPHRAFLNHLRELSFDDEESTFKLNGEEDEDQEPTEKVELKPTSHPIRSLALSSLSVNPRSKFLLKDDLRESYDEALVALKCMRDAHMKVVASYIITPSRGKPSDQYAPLPAEFTGQSSESNGKRKADDLEIERAEKRRSKRAKNEERSRMKEAEDEDEEEGNQKGTGGTNLVTFLKDCVTNTVDTMLGSDES